MQKDNKDRWEIISSKTVYKCRWFYVDKEKIKYPDGHEGFYYVLRRYGPFVAVVAKREEKTLLIKQHRQSIRKEIWEFPMGAVDNGEKIKKAAKREFLEETGYKALELEKVGRFYVGPGLTDQRGTVFLANRVKKAEKQLKGEPGEIISDCAWVDCDKLEKDIFDGKIEDGPTITAYFMVKNYLKRKK